MGAEQSELAGILDSDPAKLFAALVGDWLSLGTAVWELTSFIVERWRQRKKDRSSRSPLGVAARLVGDQEALFEAQAAFESEHLLLVADAFFAAWIQCRDLRVVPYPNSERIQADLAIRLAQCWQPPLVSDNPDPRAQLRMIAALTGPPTLTPYYRMLWRAFTDPTLGPVLIPPEYQWECIRTRDVYRVFEGYFYGYYNAGLASDEGDSLKRYLHGQRTELPRALFRRQQVQDMAGWGCLPVAHVGSSALPHSQLYVEPYARQTGVPQVEPERSNFFDLLPKLLGTAEALGHQVVVVLGAPGVGKSLAARELVLRTAQRYFRSSSTQGVPFPIYIQGSLLLQKEANDTLHIQQIIRTALHAHGQRLKATQGIQNACFDPPTDDEPVLLVVDDIDAAQLTKKQQQALFLALGSQDRKHQAVLLSRSAGLDAEVLGEFEIPQVELLEFETRGTDSQVQEWLARWNLLVKPKKLLTQASLEQRDPGLLTLAKRPILLRILAETWDRLSSGPPTAVLLFAEFTQQVVRFRLEPAVRTQRGSVEDLLGRRVVTALAAKHIVSPDVPVAVALTWILARLAWESVCQSEQRHTLTKKSAREILHEELALPEPDAVLARLCDAVLLCEEPGLAAQGNSLTFGHDSFRQYLAATFWVKQLQRLRSDVIAERERVTIEQQLCQGRLTVNRLCLEMLLDQLRELSTPERTELAALGIEYFLKDDADQTSQGATTSRKWLKESMLALACYLSLASASTDSEVQGAEAVVELPSSSTLRRLAAEVEQGGQRLLLLAPGLAFSQHGGQGRVTLAGLRLRRSCLDHARLAAADLRGVDLSESSLRGVDLKEADLRGANLSDCDLRDADLRGANLRRVDLSRAILDGAQLDAAHLEQSSLSNASMRSTSLRRARLDHANLEGADLTSADLRECSLLMANLRRARLSGAKLREANLTGADLEDAKLNQSSGTRVRAARAWLRGVTWEESLIGWHPDGTPHTDFLAEQLVSGVLIADAGQSESTILSRDSDHNQAG